MANSSDKSAEKGLLEAHSPAASDEIAASLQRLAADLEETAGEQLDLIDGSPDLGDFDSLAKAANLVAAKRRGPGRPAGSPNRRNTQVFDYLEQMGHRDPAVTLSMIQTADTKNLARELGLDSPKGRAAVFAIQMRAAADLMPYKYAKRPQQIELPPGADMRPFMLIGEMNVQNVRNGDGFMSVDDGYEKPNEINGSSVRHRDGKSQGAETVNDIKDMDGDSS